MVKISPSQVYLSRRVGLVDHGRASRGRRARGERDRDRGARDQRGVCQ